MPVYNLKKNPHTHTRVKSLKKKQLLPFAKVSDVSRETHDPIKILRLNGFVKTLNVPITFYRMSPTD